MLSYGMTDPFSSSANLQLTTINTLKSVILACWPRISQPIHYRLILKSMVACWKNIEHNKADQADLKEGLKDLSRLLVTGAETGDPSDTEYGINSDVLALVEADSRLGELFGLEITGGGT